MKLPFVSRKEYERVQKNYEITNDARKKLNQLYKDIQADYERLINTNRELGIALEKDNVDLLEAKKEIKRLKTLLSKNKIEYKKEK